MRPTAILLLGLSLLLLVSCGEAGEPHADEHAEAGDTAAEHHDDHEGEGTLEIEASMRRDLRVTTERVARHPAGDEVRVAGELSVDANRYAEIAVPMEARVESLGAEPGQKVARGMFLATLRSARLGEVRAAVHAADARLTAARAVVERNTTLGVGRIVPRREMDEAEAALAAAESEANAARAALEALGAPLDHEGDASESGLTSPIAGTVIERALVVGQVAGPGTTAFRVADLTQLWIIAHAFERDAVRIEPGTSAKVELAAFPGAVFEATVTWIGDEVEAASRTIPVRLEIDNSGGRLRPGMSALVRVTLAGDGGSVLVVPTPAVQRVGEAWVVFVPKGDHTFEIREVGRGRDLDGEVEIVSGLTEGEEVVVDGAFLLKAEVEKRSGGGDAHGH